MKKLISLAFCLMLLLSLAGCSSRSIVISGADKLEIMSGRTGTIQEITDLQDIRRITGILDGISFSQEKKSNVSDWCYSLQFYDAKSNVIDKILFMSDRLTVMYDGQFYRCSGNKLLNLDDLDALFSKVVLRATISEIDNTAMLVIPQPGYPEFSYASAFRIPGHIEYIMTGPEYEVGDLVEITYSGRVEETYPPRLAGITSIAMIEKSSEKTVSYNGRSILVSTLSKSTLDWLDKYNQLSPEEQQAVSFVPGELKATGLAPETVPVPEETQPTSQETKPIVQETTPTDTIPQIYDVGEFPAMAMVNGILYYNSAEIDTSARCGMMDGTISSYVSGVPRENGQSNFGVNFGYQLGHDDSTIEVQINDQWHIFKQYIPGTFEIVDKNLHK